MQDDQRRRTLSWRGVRKDEPGKQRRAIRRLHANVADRLRWHANVLGLAEVGQAHGAQTAQQPAMKHATRAQSSHSNDKGVG